MDFQGIIFVACNIAAGITISKATRYGNEDTRKFERKFLPWWVYLLLVVAFIFAQYVIRLFIRSCRTKKENNLTDEAQTRDEYQQNEIAPPSYIEVTERIQLNTYSLTVPPPPTYDVAVKLCEFSGNQKQEENIIQSSKPQDNSFTDHKLS